MREIVHCEVCGAKTLEPVLDLGPHPMCDDLVAIGDTRACQEYPIEILYCASCRTAHQRFQVPKTELFPKTYHYRSRFTADVLTGMKGLVESCETRFGSLKGKVVLDIGCNDGSLLDFFRDKGAKTAGIEPTGAAADASAKGHAVVNDFLSPATAEDIAQAHGKPDLITFTNVFAHIENLNEVIASLKRLLSPKTAVAIENHYLGAIFENNQFDTFYHEHPRTYSLTSFAAIAKSLGLDLLDAEFPARYGGNIRVFLGRATSMPDVCAAAKTREAGFAAAFKVLEKNVSKWKANKGRELAALIKKNGPLRAKAFPGRAAILVKLLGLDPASVSIVHEKPGSLKIGHYIPGTRIPIASDDDYFALKNKSRPILNLAWHIPAEIRDYLISHGHTGPIVNIISQTDFL